MTNVGAALASELHTEILSIVERAQGGAIVQSRTDGQAAKCRRAGCLESRRRKRGTLTRLIYRIYVQSVQDQNYDGSKSARTAGLGHEKGPRWSSPLGCW